MNIVQEGNILQEQLNEMKVLMTQLASAIQALKASKVQQQKQQPF